MLNGCLTGEGIDHKHTVPEFHKDIKSITFMIKIY